MKRDFKHMLDALVKVDNIMIWDGITRPFFEAYYLKIVDPDTKWSLFVRYSFSTSTAHNQSDKASLWAIYISNGGQKTVLKESFDLQKHEIVHTNQFISIGNSFLSLAEAVGSVHKNKECIKWELVFEDPVISARLLPYTPLYHLKLLKTKVIQPRMLGFVSGDIYINGKKFNVGRTRAHQGHLYGNSYFHHWAWVNCIDFKEDSEAYFEALSLKVPLLKVPLLKVPLLKKRALTLNFFTICMDGKKYFANSLMKALFFNKSRYNNKSWEAEFACRGYKFVCQTKRDPLFTAGLRYEGPNAAVAYCYHSPLATIEITVYKRKRGQWQYYKTLSAQKKCSFETVSSQKDPVLSLDFE